MPATPTRLRRLLAAALAFCMLCGGLAAGTSPEDDAKYRVDMEDGIKLLRSGNRDEINRSIAKFKSALKIRPESAEAYYWIALAYSDLNNYLRAGENAKDATIYDDRMAEAWLLWGQVLLYQKEWNEALRKLEEASRLAPEDPLVLFNLGRVYYHGFKDPDSALPKFRAVWQRSQILRRERPENAALVIRARLYMGYCEYERGRWDNAINAFRDVLAEQPYNYDAALRLALAYRKNNRADECDRIFVNLLKAIPADSPANVQLLAEVNLQLADLYLKDPVFRNPLFVLVNLNQFVERVKDTGHPTLEPVRDFLAEHSGDPGQR
jgi:tetratricopeptide (TPR) repeat protein